MSVLNLKWQPKWYLSYSGKVGMTSNCVKKVKSLSDTNFKLFQSLDQQMEDSVGLAEAALEMTEAEGTPRLKKAIEVTYRTAIQDALYKDLGKPKVEAELSEVYQIIGDIKFAKQHLHKWMRKQRVATPLAMLGSSSYYTYQPKGVCLIISPWNSLEIPTNWRKNNLLDALHK